MPANPSKISRLWQELKRRNVFRVITVYAASAFVILELVDIIAEPFGLPGWTLKLVFVLLTVGLIIAIVLSWIYDLHPEEGVVRTAPAGKKRSGKGAAGTRPAKSSRWRIASYISFVIIAGLIVLNIIPRGGKSSSPVTLDKSIAVLPFRNDSPDEEKMYFINGTMEAILDNLCKIEDLRVPGRTSVEQYRDLARAIPLIAKELNVSYILEGSGQKIGNRVLLTIQLIEGATDHHLWSRQYDREIRRVEDLIDIQSEIARMVAGEIEAIISPAEIERMEKVPTRSVTAYDFYQRGRDEHWKYWKDNDDREALRKAEELYHRALDHDSAFARAYTGLARVYWDKHYWEEFFSENFLDSAMILCDKALACDRQLPEAYLIRGNYFFVSGQTKAAIEALDLALSYNPNYREAYYAKGQYYLSGGEEMDLAILNLQKASLLQRDHELPVIIRWIALAYQWMGFMDQANTYLEEALSLDGDSAVHYARRAISEIYTRDYSRAIEFLEKAYALDSLDLGILNNLGENYQMAGQHEQSLHYFKSYVRRLENTSSMRTGIMHRVGYAYWMNGYEKEANEYMDLEIQYCQEMIRLNRMSVQNRYVYYDLAALYAFKGQRELALENLQIFNGREKMPLWVVSLIKDDPLFDKIRDEPEFQQIVQDIEAKYRAEHERVRRWLEEHEML